MRAAAAVVPRAFERDRHLPGTALTNLSGCTVAPGVTRPSFVSSASSSASVRFCRYDWLVGDSSQLAEGRRIKGRLLGRSPLLASDQPEVYLRRNRTPAHAFSETDRLTARPADFQASSIARSAGQTWRDWRSDALTSHDGIVCADHPVLHAVADRTQSASSLRLLLRNPLGFVWRYGLHLTAPESSQEPLVIDALGLGELVHDSLDLALRSLESAGGFAAATALEIAAAVNGAVTEVAALWEASRATPPLMIWEADVGRCPRARDQSADLR